MISVTITVSPDRMSGQPCVGESRLTVAQVFRLLSESQPVEILRDYPYLSEDDLTVLAAVYRRAIEVSRGE